MTRDGYADLAEVEAVVLLGGAVGGKPVDKQALGVLNGRLATEIDNHTRRTFTNVPGVTWTRDAPYGPLLLLPDFSAVQSVTINGGANVVTSCVKRTLPDPNTDGPPWQGLLYAPAGVPTGWGGGLATGLQMVVVQVTAGWPSPPDGVVQAATRLLCRLWRTQINLYADTGGDALSGLVHSAAPLLDDTAKTDLAAYVRKRVPTIVSS